MDEVDEVTDVTHADAPQWLRGALAQAPEQHHLIVDGVTIHYLAWGEPGDTPVVLVHGGLAHAHWWDHVGPMLTGRRVVSLDLSGHGDSGARDSYDARQWAREIMAVVRDAGLVRPVLVGHSMGGQPAVACGGAFSSEISAVITVDTRFNDARYERRDKPSQLFASREEGVGAFAPIHGERGVEVPPLLLRHLAETSLGRDGAVWRWKRDDRYHIDHIPFRELLQELRAPFAIIRTEHGLVTPESAEEMHTLARSNGVDVEIPAAGHNPMIEQPVAFVAVLRALLQYWVPTLHDGVPASGAQTWKKNT